MRRDIVGSIVGITVIVFTVVLITDNNKEESYMSQVSARLSQLTREFEDIESGNPVMRNPASSVRSIVPAEPIPNNYRLIKNTTDLFQFQWVPYLKQIYKTKLGDCFYGHNRVYKHNYTAPLLSCETDLPTYTDDQRKTMTRKQIKIWCEGSVAFRKYEDVPLFSHFFTMGGDSASRECLHNYINQHCYDQYPIPNVVHWIYYGNSTFDQLWNAMSWYSVFKIMKPCLVLMHGTHPNTGGYWDTIIPHGHDILYIPKEPQQLTAKGQTFTNIANKADIARLEVLKEFGGVYLDFDEIILKPVDIFRAVAYSAFVEGNSNDLTNSVMFVRKNHPFLDTWLKHWETYDGKAWKSHSINYFTSYVYKKLEPGLVQVFGPLFHHLAWWPLDRIRLYQQPCDVFDAFGQHLYHKHYPTDSGIEYIKTANTTFGMLARYLFFNDGENCLTKGYKKR